MINITFYVETSDTISLYSRKLSAEGPDNIKTSKIYWWKDYKKTRNHLTENIMKQFFKHNEIQTTTVLDLINLFSKDVTFKLMTESIKQINKYWIEFYHLSDLDDKNHFNAIGAFCNELKIGVVLIYPNRFPAFIRKHITVKTITNKLKEYLT